MVTIVPDVVADHAQHVHQFADQLKSAKDHAVHDGHWTEIALGGMGQIIFWPMDVKIEKFADAIEALSGKAVDVKKAIDATAKTYKFVEEANKQIMDTTKTQIHDPDLFHAPTTINDFPDAGLVSDIGGFASNCPQYSEAGALSVTLGSIGLALDVLGWFLDPAANCFGDMAGIIIDLIYPVKELLDWLLGDPGALQDASAAFEQIAQYLSETAHTFAASLAQITPQTWDEPGSSDKYLSAANNLIQLAVTVGGSSEQISGDIYTIGAFIGDLRANVFDHAMGFVLEAVITMAAGAAASPFTFGSSLAAAIGLVTTEAELTILSVGLQVSAAFFRLGAAAEVATSQAQNYDKLVADLKK